MLKRLLCTSLAVVLTAVLMVSPAIAAANGNDAGEETSSSSKDRRVEVSRISISTPTLTVRVNQTRMLFETFTPSNATNKDVSWYSSNEEVAIVDEEGIVTGISPGTATITVEANNGRKATCVVTVPGKAVSALEQDVATQDLTGNSGVLSSQSVRYAVEQAIRASSSNEAVVIPYQNVTTISATAVKGAAFTADYEKGRALLQFDTTDSNDKVLGRMTVDPAKAKDLEIDIGLQVSAGSQKAQSVANLFAKHFTNQTAVIAFTHDGSFGMDITVAAKVDATGLKTDQLQLYAYDSATNQCLPLDNQAYTLDANGYLHFTTNKGGSIIVTDSALQRK